jgi:hypothetical protein
LVGSPVAPVSVDSSDCDIAPFAHPFVEGAASGRFQRSCIDDSDRLLCARSGRSRNERFATTIKLYAERNSGGEPSPVDQRKADGLRRSRFGRKQSRTSASMSCSPSSVRLTASRRRTVCACDMSVKELIETKELVDAALAEILGGGSVKKERKSQTCSKCGSEEHSTRTCARNCRLQRCDII